MARFARFNTWDEMLAYAAEGLGRKGDWRIEAGIYTDDKIWYRPQLILFLDGDMNEIEYLRWFAYDEEETETRFIGKRARVEARNKAESLVVMVEQSV